MVNFGPITTEDFILGFPGAPGRIASHGRRTAEPPCCPSRGKSGFGNAERGEAVEQAKQFAEPSNMLTLREKTMARTLLIMTWHSIYLDAKVPRSVILSSFQVFFCVFCEAVAGGDSRTQASQVGSRGLWGLGAGCSQWIFLPVVGFSGRFGVLIQIDIRILPNSSFATSPRSEKAWEPERNIGIRNLK